MNFWSSAVIIVRPELNLSCFTPHASEQSNNNQLMHMIVRAVLFYVVVMDYRSEHAFMLACKREAIGKRSKFAPTMRVRKKCACARISVCDSPTHLHIYSFYIGRPCTYVQIKACLSLQLRLVWTVRREER